MHHHHRRTFSAAFTTAALITGIAACGSSSSHTHAASQPASPKPTVSKDPLASLSGQQVIKKALTDTESAHSVHLVVTTTDADQLGYDVMVVPGEGCRGTVSEGEKGSFKLIELNKQVYLLPDKTFWEQNGGSDPAALKILSGKWLAVTFGKSDMADMAKMCSLNALLGTLASAPADIPKSSATVNGQRVVRFSDTGDAGYIDVSDTATPELVTAEASGQGNGLMHFSDYNAPVTLSPPPASQTLDGSKYGF